MEPPEVRLADRLVREFGLLPPVDIDALARKFATVELLPLPNDSDAIVCDLGTGSPKIFANSRKAVRRRRFTMAHELAHVVLPWHAGLLICHTDTFGAADVFYEEFEQEANRFASHLLLPTAFVQPFTDAGVSIPDIFRGIEVANVSAHVAMFRVAPLLPSGHLLVLAAEGRVELALSSPGVRVNKPPTGAPLQIEHLSKLASDLGLVKFAGRLIRWWCYDSKGLQEHNQNVLSSSILQQLLSASAMSPEKMKAATHRINGIVSNSYAASKGERSAEEIYAAMMARFTSRPDLSELLEDPRFEQFLSQKAHELSLRSRR